jgi:hypothetical protein
MSVYNVRIIVTIPIKNARGHKHIHINKFLSSFKSFIKFSTRLMTSSCVTNYNFWTNLKILTKLNVKLFMARPMYRRNNFWTYLNILIK